MFFLSYFNHLGFIISQKMFKLTRRIEYCLMIMAHMDRMARMSPSKDGERLLVNVTEIVKVYGIPKMNAAKAVQRLARKGLVESRQGVHGGYMLSCDLSTVSLFDLIEIAEGPFGVVKCLRGNDKNSCSYFSDCNIATPMQRFNEKLVDFYKKITLDEMVWGVISKTNQAKQANQADRSSQFPKKKKKGKVEKVKKTGLKKTKQKVELLTEK